MRKIGSITGENDAAVLGAYLFAQGIENDMDAGSDDNWSVWIHSDDKLEAAREILSHFESNPTDSRYMSGAKLGQQKLAAETAKAERFKKNYYDGKRVFKRLNVGIVTAVLMGLSVVISVISGFGDHEVPFTDHILISSIYYSNGLVLPEILSGQVWRLVTPIFLHFNFIHLLFNMMWISDLGTVVERRHGSLALLIFVLLIAIPSNLLQFLASGPSFGGMSGVVYGLLGYLWIRGKVDPFYEIHLRRETVTMMGIWFVLCIVLSNSNMGMHVANMAHGGGLAVGMLAGYLLGFIAKRSRFGKTE